MLDWLIVGCAPGSMLTVPPLLVSTGEQREPSVSPAPVAPMDLSCSAPSLPGNSARVPSVTAGVRAREIQQLTCPRPPPPPQIRSVSPQF